MKIDIFKKLIKEAVREAIQDELKDILLEAVKSNKQPIKESYQTNDDRTLNFNSNNVPKTPINTKKSYIEILEEMSKGPKSGFEGEFKVDNNIDPVSGTLPEGQLGLDQIMNLIKK